MNDEFLKITSKIFVFILISQLLNENGPLALRCFTLKDFQQSIDLYLVSDGNDTMFCGSNNSDAYECREMRENERWKFQVF